MTRLPTFLVIGAPKCGTTSLFYYLRQHPEVYLPVRKELHYFTYGILQKKTEGPSDKSILKGLCKTREEYESHYRAVDQERAIGEISPSYLYYPEIGNNIKKELGNDIKIIIILRDPIDRAFSQYMHMVRDLRETLSFYDAILDEKKRKTEGWGDIWLYSMGSLYSEYIKMYLDIFGEKNVKIVYFEDLVDDAMGVMKELFEYLEVDTAFKCDTGTIYNRSGVARSEYVARFFSNKSLIKSIGKLLLPERIRVPVRLALMNWNTGAKGEIDRQALDYLRAYYRDDVCALSNIVGCSPPWKDTSLLYR